MKGQTVIIGGGSEGVGKELAELMVLRGANIIILARNAEKLAAVQKELSPKRIYGDQLIETQSIDLSDATRVQNFVRSLTVVPSYVYCVAGGTAEEVGLFAEITPEQISSCFQKNFFTSAFLAHSIMCLWIDKPEDKEPKHLIFTNSTAAFVAIPGYVAYTSAKSGVRALADTLRQEVLLYASIVDIQIHCSFPGTFLTDAFAREQERKPEICKQLEGTANPSDIKNAMTSKAVAIAIVKGVDKGLYFISMNMQTRLLLNGMRGPSPSETWGWDWFLGLGMSLAWPITRRIMDRKVRKHGLTMQT